MSLDFDNIDEGAPTYAELVASGRFEILKGASVESCWEQLVVTHDAFTEVARQAKLRGTCLADVTVALRVVASANEKVDASSRGTSSSYTVSSLEQPLITQLANMYQELYSTSPVPTVHQWLSLVQEKIISDKFLIELSKQEQAARSSPTSTVSVSTYQRKLLNVLQGELCDDSDDATGDDDGTFAENELRLFVKRCLTLARRCKRAHAAGSREEHQMQGAVDVLHRFICSDTLEW